MKKRTESVAFGGILTALCVTLSFLESLIPMPSFLPPGAKLGLANLTVLLCVFWQLPGLGAFLTGIKALFALLTGGLAAFFFSLCGGLASLLIMLFLARFERLPEASVSMGGALSSNLAQTATAAVLYGSSAFFAYLPAVIPMGIFSGLLTGVLFRWISPHLLPFKARLSGHRRGTHTHRIKDQEE